MNKQEQEVIEETKKKIESTQKGLKEGKYYGEQFNLEREIKREQIILNLIDKLEKENENLNKKNKRYEKYLKNKDIEHEKVLEYIETEKEREYISKDKIYKIIDKIIDQSCTYDEMYTTALEDFKEIIEKGDIG